MLDVNTHVPNGDSTREAVSPRTTSPGCNRLSKRHIALRSPRLTTPRPHATAIWTQNVNRVATSSTLFADSAATAAEDTADVETTERESEKQHKRQRLARQAPEPKSGALSDSEGSERAAAKTHPAPTTGEGISETDPGGALSLSAESGLVHRSEDSAGGSLPECCEDCSADAGSADAGTAGVRAQSNGADSDGGGAARSGRRAGVHAECRNGSSGGSRASGAGAGAGEGTHKAIVRLPATMVWNEQRIKYVYSMAKAELDEGHVPDFVRMMEQLGWHNQPGHHRVLSGIRAKYASMRRLVEHGIPLENRIMPRVKYPYPLVCRVREALLSFPLGQGTIKEVRDAIDADPLFSPYLDRRPHVTDGARRARWQQQVGYILTCQPRYGFLPVGAKKGGASLYKYDPDHDRRRKDKDPVRLALASLELDGADDGDNAEAMGGTPITTTTAGDGASRGEKGLSLAGAGEGAGAGISPRRGGSEEDRRSGGAGLPSTHSFLAAAAAVALAALEDSRELVEQTIAAAVLRRVRGTTRA